MLLDINQLGGVHFSHIVDYSTVKPCELNTGCFTGKQAQPERIIEIHRLGSTVLSEAFYRLLNDDILAIRGEGFTHSFHLRFNNLEAFTKEVAGIIAEATRKKVLVSEKPIDIQEFSDIRQFKMHLYLQSSNPGGELLLWNTPRLNNSELSCLKNEAGLHSRLGNPEILDYGADELIIFPANKLYEHNNWDPDIHAVIEFTLYAENNLFTIYAHPASEHSLRIANNRWLSPKSSNPDYIPPLPAW